jgi:hypothetical protein
MILFFIVKCRLLLVSSDMISRFGFRSFLPLDFYFQIPMTPIMRTKYMQVSILYVPLSVDVLVTLIYMVNHVVSLS